MPSHDQIRRVYLAPEQSHPNVICSPKFGVRDTARNYLKNGHFSFYALL